MKLEQQFVSLEDGEWERVLGRIDYQRIKKSEKMEKDKIKETHSGVERRAVG